MEFHQAPVKCKLILVIKGDNGKGIKFIIPKDHLKKSFVTKLEEFINDQGYTMG